MNLSLLRKIVLAIVCLFGWVGCGGGGGPADEPSDAQPAGGSTDTSSTTTPSGSSTGTPTGTPTGTQTGGPSTTPPTTPPTDPKWPPAIDSLFAQDGSCKVPACSETEASGLPSSMTTLPKTANITTKASTCGELVQSVDPRTKPGNAQTENLTYDKVKGSCTYRGTEHVMTIKNGIGVMCEKKEEVMGVTTYRGGTVDFNNGGTGHLRINITKIPIEGLDCSLEMDVKVNL